MENNIYYIYNNFPCRLSVRPSVPVSQRTLKTFSVSFSVAKVQQKVTTAEIFMEKIDKIIVTD